MQENTAVAEESSATVADLSNETAVLRQTLDQSSNSEQQANREKKQLGP